MSIRKQFKLSVYPVIMARILRVIVEGMPIISLKTVPIFMKTLHKKYKVDKTKIGFIRFIFEAYEGVAVSTTLDPKTGYIRLAIAPDRTETADMIIEDLKKDFQFDEL